MRIRVGVDLIDRYPDGVWFCDFSPVTDPGLVARAVAKVQHVREHANHSLADSIVRALSSRQSLLIFDNCEHILDSAAELVDDILHNCPGVHVLATSRQVLGIMGEIVLRVRSLSVPESTSDFRPDSAMYYGAIELFLNRAQAADRAFVLTKDNAPFVAEICRRLDGIPLAIETAAARVNAVTVQNLAQSLDDRFKVLTAGGRTSLPRHKTLSALVDWSYDRLSQREKVLFDRLGIFGGGFSLPAVKAVCADEKIADSEVLDLLIALVEKSLVVAQTDGEQERYRLLESTRAYALEKLAADRERERLARRHAEYFRDLAMDADKHYGMGSTTAWLTRMELELQNYRASLEWAITREGDVATGAALAGALERLWALAALSVEARTWLDAALARVTETEHLAVTARLWLAKARFLQGEPMRDCAQRALYLLPINRRYAWHCVCAALSCLWPFADGSRQ